MAIIPLRSPRFESLITQATDISAKMVLTIDATLRYTIIKDWMRKAKAGVIDYFDVVKGLSTGDIKRAKPYEIDFLMKVLDKDKVLNRFRSYFGGKKGKKRD